MTWGAVASTMAARLSRKMTPSRLPPMWTPLQLAVMEPDALGAEEQVVSLYSHTGRRRPPRLRADEVEAALRPEHRPAQPGRARYIASAGSLLLDSRRLRRAVPTSRKSAATSSGSAPDFACPRGLASEELRLLSAITPGRFYRGTVQALADRYVVFHDDYGAVSRLLRAHPGRGAGPGLPHHHLPLRHAPRRQDRPSLHPGPPAGFPHRQPVAPGAAARRAGRPVYLLFVDRENLAATAPVSASTSGRQQSEQAADLMAQAKRRSRRLRFIIASPDWVV